MDFHELEAFVALAGTLHFARAAAMVNVSPSALSRLLARLEDELGVSLLSRDTRRVELTEQGQAFLNFARESLQRRDELHLFMNSRDGQLRGTLRIYASVTACYSILPPLVSELGLRFPDLRLSVETGDPADALTEVRAGRVDLALAALPESVIEGHLSFSVQRTPLVFVALADGPYGQVLRRLLALQEKLRANKHDLDQDLIKSLLKEHALLLPRKGLARERLERWARRTRVQFRIAAEVSGNEAILALARLGLGLGLVPRLVLENSPFSQGLLQLEPGQEFGDYDIGFVLPDKTGSSLDQAMRSVLPSVYPAGTWITKVEN